MTAAPPPYCRACRRVRPLGDFLLVEPVGPGIPFYVCRPGGQAFRGESEGGCFREVVGSVHRHRITPALEGPAR